MTTKQVGTTKKSKPPIESEKPKPNKSRYLEVTRRPGVSDDRLLAEHAFDPATGNASTALDFSNSLFPDLSLQECAAVMKGDADAVTGGNLAKLEAMLTGQAIALNAMFNNFAKRAIHAEVMPTLDTYFRLALKAQSQCRTTVESIAEIKFPRSATFIKQANIAQKQQVNNGRPVAENHSETMIEAENHAEIVINKVTNTRICAPEKTINPTNELISEQANATLDTAGAGASSRLDSGLEAVGTVNRAAHSKRKIAE